MSITTKETAKEIVLHGYGVTWKTDTELVAAIDAALIARDERAAGICDAAANLASPEGVIPAGDPEHDHLARISAILTSAAAAIRQGSTDAKRD